MNSLDEVKRLVASGYALQALCDSMSDGVLSSGNVSKLEDVVNQLEIHEAEVRRVRQSLSIRLRQQVLESHLADFKKRAPA